MAEQMKPVKLDSGEIVGSIEDLPVINFGDLGKGEGGERFSVVEIAVLRRESSKSYFSNHSKGRVVGVLGTNGGFNQEPPSRLYVALPDSLWDDERGLHVHGKSMAQLNLTCFTAYFYFHETKGWVQREIPKRQ